MKLQAQACNFIRKEILTQVFSCEFCKISKNTLLTEHLWATASACEKCDELFQSVYVEPVSLTNEIGIDKNGHNHVDSTYT